MSRRHVQRSPTAATASSAPADPTFHPAVASARDATAQASATAGNSTPTSALPDSVSSLALRAPVSAAISAGGPFAWVAPTAHATAAAVSTAAGTTAYTADTSATRYARATLA